MCEVVLRIKIADMALPLLSNIFFKSFPALDFVSAKTSTKAGDSERITASQREHRNDTEITNKNETVILNIFRALDYQIIESVSLTLSSS